MANPGMRTKARKPGRVKQDRNSREQARQESRNRDRTKQEQRNRDSPEMMVMIRRNRDSLERKTRKKLRQIS